MPNFRVCSEHRADIKNGPISASGREILYCSIGHECRSWLVINADGTIVGVGKINEYIPKEIRNEGSRSRGRRNVNHSA